MDDIIPTRNKSYDNSILDINDEVQKLFRKTDKGNIQNNLFKLKNKYDAKSYETIQKNFYERYNLVMKKAKKFAELMRKKYGLDTVPYHILLETSKLFKKKYNLSDEEYAEYQRIYENELNGINSPDVMKIETNLMKVLGPVHNLNTSGFNIKFNDTDWKYLDDIMKLYASSAQIHSQVLFQSIEYEDCANEALNGDYKKELGFRTSDNVHPIIAALFIPKVDILDSHFIHSNICRIVKHRHNNEIIKNIADHELIYSLITDPNDIVCDNHSIVLDLFNRAQIQIQLWNNVLYLRGGHYYNNIFKDFISSIDQCRMNKNDTPDFIYGKHDDKIIKRLLSAFSFRPTTVFSQPAYNSTNINPYQQNIRPIVSHIPLINFMIPPNLTDEEISLTDALTQQQLIFQNGILTNKVTNIIDSRGVLFIYVERKKYNININDINRPFYLNKLPTAISGLDRLNTKYIQIPDAIDIKDTKYKLKSVVLSELGNLSENDIIVGTSAIIIEETSDGVFNTEKTYHYYNPNKISYFDNDTKQFVERKPIEQIRYEKPFDNDVINYVDMVSTRGIIYMYVKENN